MPQVIKLTKEIPAPVGSVWAELADIASHPEWMGDARSVEFLTERRQGTGTRFRVPTRVGPLRTSDVLEVVGWEPDRALVVAHMGAVGGTGRFFLTSSDNGTTVTWEEELLFPWWLGGRVGGWLAAPLLRRVWRLNLEALADRVVSDP